MCTKLWTFLNIHARSLFRHTLYTIWPFPLPWRGTSRRRISTRRGFYLTFTRSTLPKSPLTSVCHGAWTRFPPSAIFFIARRQWETRSSSSAGRARFLRDWATSRARNRFPICKPYELRICNKRRAIKRQPRTRGIAAASTSSDLVVLSFPRDFK